MPPKYAAAPYAPPALAAPVTASGHALGLPRQPLLLPNTIAVNARGTWSSRPTPLLHHLLVGSPTLRAQFCPGASLVLHDGQAYIRVALLLEADAADRTWPFSRGPIVLVCDLHSVYY